MIDHDQLKAESEAIATLTLVVDIAARDLSPLAQLGLATGITRTIFNRIAGQLGVSYPKLVGMLARRLLMTEAQPRPDGG
jgi:hypothetical protein